MFVSPPLPTGSALVKGTAEAIPQVVDYEIFNGSPLRRFRHLKTTLWVS
jgi:hypothetical protein